eukprot:TRINITY_DN22970_c0_g1_i1.p1 TRINITY_DN22970_c0_g1~~TRINITY_DN22970_c0_g1_i1.p1  ORF type:complete len:204 (+),score=33.96 TRINITY_DN22970_c0_g1_i1:242-853(+)
MRQNYNSCLYGEQQKVLLVPYRPEHVPKYHEWMKDPFLQETTGSEPLTEEEEYAMQNAWAEDAEKCTFIVLDMARFDSSQPHPHLEAMAGDVNLFLNDAEDPLAAEIEVMVAEPQSRGRGLGREAVLLMMWYGIQHLGLRLFRAKIGETNEASLHLFRGLGYVETSHSEIFKQITTEWRAGSHPLDFIAARIGKVKVLLYDTD